ncbi:molybdopterin-guanine dinucleotide biosynthesis protein B [Oceanisphaera psychrotolerans]|uniref:Molybdopterin-guanine dinucleotide biosynthesis protein B n=1 Tax=Oceanisphaera psychrotolerans TaxID=1414654 RepID=A0A1J4QCZ7_9GAMM|nr:molybdopterin-guanine dinucleotide biosynthesis protein B [Oceanisphaera psychrotolerans]OIN09209.1 molybdopterin-guanine dinucleotide biosynthesis protein B [Oceanisphaera psychrotolerans]
MSPSHHACALLGFAGFSGSGKTTLLRQLVSLLTRRQMRIGIIKHTHHDVEQDTPGKDSFELRHAGARQCLLAGPHRSILTWENTKTEDADLQLSLSRLSLDQLDLVLVEGFRDAPIAKIEVHRPVCAKPLLCLHDPHILAVATDVASLVAPVPLLDLNDPAAVADVIFRWWQAGRLRVRSD